MAVIVGLTGGIATGKSAVADLLAGRGAVIVDADLLAREVVAPGTAGLAAIVARFGTTVLGPDGSLDRAALAGVVFADPDARRDLEAIVHPAVRSRAAEQVSAAVAADPSGVVVQVIPLLVETGQAHAFDCCVVVEVPPEVQLRRLLARTAPDGRTLSRAEATARIAAQSDRATRLAAATWVIDNAAGLAELAGHVDRLWAHLHPHAPHPGWAAPDPRPAPG